MNSTIDNPKIGNFLLIAILLTSTITAIYVGKILPAKFGGGQEWPGYLFISISILLGAYFLPETANKKFSSRQSALGGASLFLWLAMYPMLETTFDFGLSGPISLIAAFSFYWIALRLIRVIKAPQTKT